MMGTGIIPIILISIFSTCSSTNESYEKCIKSFGKIIEQDLCIPENYRKNVLPPGPLPFKIDVTMMITSITTVSMKFSSFSLYYSSHATWRDSRCDTLSFMQCRGGGSSLKSHCESKLWNDRGIIYLWKKYILVYSCIQKQGKKNFWNPTMSFWVTC